MDLVADANILMSIFIKSGDTAKVLSNSSINVFVPEYIFQEIEEHKEEILRKTYRHETDFEIVIEQTKEIVHTISESRFIDFLDEAEKISPDPDDAVYFALALKLNCPIWSNDKKLVEQNRVRIYTTKELIDKN